MLETSYANQMELGLNAPAGVQATRETRTTEKARWWFGQMRRVVGSASEWKPASGGRPGQGRTAPANGKN